MPFRAVEAELDASDTVLSRHVLSLHVSHREAEKAAKAQASRISKLRPLQRKRRWLVRGEGERRFLIWIEYQQMGT